MKLTSRNERKEQTERFGKKVIKSMEKEFGGEIDLDNTAFAMLAVTETDDDFHVWAIRYDKNAMDIDNIHDALNQDKGTHSIATISAFDSVKGIAEDVSERINQTQTLSVLLSKLERKYG